MTNPYILKNTYLYNLEGGIRMIKKLVFATIVASVYSITNAAGEPEVLFYTDFLSTPAEFAAASQAATAAGTYDTLLHLPSGESEPLFTVIDACTLGVTPSSSSDRHILLSKGSQDCVKHGDTAECTKGRLSLKNSDSYIILPEVTGPCTITYHAASSSSSDLNRGFQCVINGISAPEAGTYKLQYGEDTVQATIKMEYGCAIEGPVHFKLIAMGGVYLYDIKVEAGISPTSVKQHTNAKSQTTLQTNDNQLINSNRLNVEIFSLAGKKVISSNREQILLTNLSKGIYLIRTPSAGKWKTVPLFH